MKIGLVLGVSAFLPAMASAIVCPALPQQTMTDYGLEVEAAAVKVGPLRGASVSTEAKSKATEVLSRYPNADKVYVTQMMLSTFCSGLEADKTLPEREKAARFDAFSSGVLSAVYASGLPKGDAKSGGARVQGGQNTGAVPRSKPPKVTQTTGQASPPPAVTSSKAQPEASLEDYPWLEKTVTLRIHVNQAQTPPVSYTTTWRDLFGVFSPFLIAHPYDGDIRSKVSGILAERYKASELNLPRKDWYSPSISEEDWQGISVQFRTSALAKADYSATTSGGRALFWSETPTGVVLMKKIRGQ